jgi:hypothetical protein
MRRRWSWLKNWTGFCEMSRFARDRPAELKKDGDGAGGIAHKLQP